MVKTRQANLPTLPSEKDRKSKGERTSSYTVQSREREKEQKREVSEDDEMRETEIEESLYHGERLGLENGNVEGVVKREQVERGGV